MGWLASRSATCSAWDAALRSERRVAVAVDERERLPGRERLGLAVADEEQLRRARRPAETLLAVLLLRLLGDGAEPTVRSQAPPVRWRHARRRHRRAVRRCGSGAGQRVRAVLRLPGRSGRAGRVGPRATPAATSRTRRSPGHLRRDGGDRGDGRGRRAGDHRGADRRRRRRADDVLRRVPAADPRVRRARHPGRTPPDPRGCGERSRSASCCPASFGPGNLDACAELSFVIGPIGPISKDSSQISCRTGPRRDRRPAAVGVDRARRKRGLRDGTAQVGFGWSAGRRRRRWRVGLGTGGAGAVTAGVGVGARAGHNGCTLSPTSATARVHDFHRACDAHDLCCITKPKGDTSAGRKSCDDECSACKVVQRLLLGVVGGAGPVACRGAADATRAYARSAVL